MGRGHFHPSSCKDCGRSRDDGFHISQQGLCEECGDRRNVEQKQQLRAQSGPWFDQWRRACLAAFGGVLLDDVPPRE